MVAVRQNRQMIYSMLNEQGWLLDTHEQISEEAITFSEQLLGSRNNSVSGENKKVSKEEVKAAMFAQDFDRVPEPDGYSSHFFKVAWDIVREDVSQAVFYFFEHSKMLPAFNATTLVLVLKKINPSYMRDFRLISCRSVVYKCITCIILSRLNGSLPEVISES
ncbi:uncharacterized protein LOC120165578 [Hibiscus syriacus]|uniref:uncharacterized protein LOC120165578 n=1 Tax=Hibiscus syriacus TaxID=106335 RepID=UPI001920AF8B|nr:uncharacterized protein LOC120165578 [Hibiscus syriacus]